MKAGEGGGAVCNGCARNKKSTLRRETDWHPRLLREPKSLCFQTYLDLKPAHPPLSLQVFLFSFEWLWVINNLLFLVMCNLGIGSKAGLCPHDMWLSARLRLSFERTTSLPSSWLGSLPIGAYNFAPAKHTMKLQAASRYTAWLSFFLVATAEGKRQNIVILGRRRKLDIMGNYCHFFLPQTPDASHSL